MARSASAGFRERDFHPFSEPEANVALLTFGSLRVRSRNVLPKIQFAPQRKFLGDTKGRLHEPLVPVDVEHRIIERPSRHDLRNGSLCVEGGGGQRRIESLYQFEQLLDCRAWISAAFRGRMNGHSGGDQEGRCNNRQRSTPPLACDRLTNVRTHVTSGPRL